MIIAIIVIITYREREIYIYMCVCVKVHILYMRSIDTSRTRARRVAEVSRFKDCDAIGSKDKVCL